ncbi:Poly(A) polymerase central domain-containing protein, partial [Spinellus fusiger]
LLPSGCQGLGSLITDGDMDLVVIVPSSVHHSDFFKVFGSLMHQHEMIRSMVVILRFIRLKMPAIPMNFNVLDLSVLSSCDDLYVHSLEHLRITQLILSYIKPSHLDTFRHVFQYIQHWAYQRDVDVSSFGYLNKTALVLLLLCTYISHIKTKITIPLTIYCLLANFFDMWSRWPWPTPVVINTMAVNGQAQPVSYDDLKKRENAYMSIRLPGLLGGDIVPNVTKSTLYVLTTEFKQGNSNNSNNKCVSIFIFLFLFYILVASDILHAQCIDPCNLLNALFMSFIMTKTYKHFLGVVVSNTSVASHQKW